MERVLLETAKIDKGKLENARDNHKPSKLRAHDMALLLGISDDSYRKKENGHTKFSVIEVNKLIDILGPKAVNDIFFDSKFPIG
jgi:predicted transcriptional regulator